MRVLIYPHDLGMGGSQMNAIELAAHVRNLGAETIVFGRPGVLCERIQALGLEFIESPDPGRRPSARIARQLRSIAKARGIDVLHGYEWPPSLECTVAAAMMPNTRAVSTVMSMSVPPFIPTTVPLVVGTEQICAHERARGRTRIRVLEPPVDLGHNLPSAEAELAAFRRRWGVGDGRQLVVCVSRLADELKAEGLLAAITAVADPLSDLGLQLMIVGDGPAREKIHNAAAAANVTTPGSVIMTGELTDPRPAYSAADVVLGMGGSALRALAFAKPLVVQGENGFFELLDEHSWPRFAWQGWYGVGSDSREGAANLARILRPLLADENQQRLLSIFGHRLVRDRFSIESAAAKQLDVYEQALREPVTPAEGAASWASAVQHFSAYYARRKFARLTGQCRTDDFNARPVAAATSASDGPGHRRIMDRGALVYLAGAPWHAVTGTDVQLARAMGEHRDVIWVDPPVSIVSRVRRGIRVPTVSDVAPGVTRIHTIAPPGVTRPGVRTISRWWSYTLVQRHIRRSGQKIDAVLTSSPEPMLTAWRNTAVRRVYFATDDFVAGADLLGMSQRHAESARELNLAAADSVLAVSEPLAKTLRRGDRRAITFPNGCDVELYMNVENVPSSTIVALPKPIVGVFGQLNERLDLSYLEILADAGESLLLVGPRYEVTDDFRARLDRLIARSNVQWLDRRPRTELPSLMKTLTVGLTPYVENEFNRASFPLKTLEYLAAGVPAVCTQLPATKLLDGCVVRTAGSAEEFAIVVRETIESVNGETARRCRAQAELYSWKVRARELEMIITGSMTVTG